jgi:TPP-dependent indolepyruvate ferredoxin oxidoreductase alpha subunit
MAKGFIKSGAEVIYGYPGTPLIEVIQSLPPQSRELGIQIDVEWSINEKIAFKIATGTA